MKFCSDCGQPVAHRIPEGDSRLRYVCDACSTVHYQNPKVVCGCLPVWEDRILLCRRAIERLLNSNRLIPLGEMYFTIMASPAFTGWDLNELNQLDLSELRLAPKRK